MINSEPSSNQEAEIAALVETLRMAMIAADGDILNKLASPSLSYGHSAGKLETREQFVTSFTSGKSVFVTIELAGQTIDIVDNTAIVRHILTAETNDNGKGPGAVKLSILLVWIKTGDAWQLLARQAVKLG